MKAVLVMVVIAVAGFAGGWFARAQTSDRCYVLPAYTSTSSSLLRPGASSGPQLVCR